MRDAWICVIYVQHKRTGAKQLVIERAGGGFSQAVFTPIPMDPNTCRIVWHSSQLIQFLPTIGA